MGTAAAAAVAVQQQEQEEQQARSSGRSAVVVGCTLAVDMLAVEAQVGNSFVEKPQLQEVGWQQLHQLEVARDQPVHGTSRTAHPSQRCRRLAGRRTWVGSCSRPTLLCYIVVAAAAAAAAAVGRCTAAAAGCTVAVESCNSAVARKTGGLVEKCCFALEACCRCTHLRKT